MKIKTIMVGELSTNCYIVSDPVKKEAVVIDAGDDADIILNYLEKEQLHVNLILNTHGHFDHTQANDRLRQKTGAPLAIHADDAELLLNPAKVSGRMLIRANPCKEAEQLLHNGDVITFGDCSLQVIYTPGHTKGGCCFYSAKDEVCFTGDTLFRGSIGRTDLYGGNYATIIHSVQERLAKLPDSVTIYPGHGPESTMAFERKNNRYMKG